MNQLHQTGARGKTTTYVYDRIDRLRNISYPTGIATTFEYDGGASPTPAEKGELTKMVDESGSTSYAHDSLGRLTTKTTVIAGRTFTTSYSWGDTGSALDKLIAITYPSGNRVNYSYDAQGYLNAISVNPVNPNGVGTSATSNSLLSGIGYNAENKVTGWLWSDGKARSFAYDSYGQISAYNLGDAQGTGNAAGSLRALTRDAAGRIIGYSHTNNGTVLTNLDQTFGYDKLNRLTSATLNSSSTQYSYDETGNRTSKTIAGTTYTNTIASTSNKLTQSQDVNGTATILHDAAGNIVNDGTSSFTYSDRGRLASVTTAGGTVSYLYNGLNLRVYKSGPTAVVPTGAAYYLYDEQGQLLGEYDAAGNPVYETIYLGSLPVGVLKQTGSAANSDISTTVYNVHADHIATPRVITQQDEQIVWRWDTAESFGGSVPDQNPSGLGTFTYNQRFPGQVSDAETGLFQNWNREYNSRYGRYIQSDPIGLAGGINTFAYVGGDPLNLADPEGLMGNGPSGHYKATPVNKGSGNPGVDYIQIGYSSQVRGGGITLDRYGNLYVGIQTGSIMPASSLQICFGKIRSDRKLDEKDLEDFISGSGGQASYGQFGIGFGAAFSGGNVADQLTLGTPQLPGAGSGGYTWRIGNVDVINQINIPQQPGIPGRNLYEVQLRGRK